MLRKLNLGGLDERDVKPGDTIHHEKLGNGRITQITPVTGDAILVIDFQGQTKRFMASQAALSPAGDAH